MIKIAKRIAIVLSIFLVLAFIIAHFMVPEYFDRQFTTTLTSAPTQPVSAQADKLHKTLTICDLHSDALIWGRNLTKKNSLGQVDIPRLLEGNVALQIFSVPTLVPKKKSQWGTSRSGLDWLTVASVVGWWPINSWFSLFSRADYMSEELSSIAKKEENFTLIKSVRDLNMYLTKRTSDKSITAGMLALEGMHPLENNFENLDKLFHMGYRMMGLVHFFDNEIGGSSYGLQAGGITKLGERCIQRMEELGIIVDLAHASDSLIDAVLQIATKPVVVSHTGIKGVCNRKRNISDKHALLICEQGGLIGIGFWRGAVCGDDVGAIVRSIMYVVDLVGIDHVTLGSDFDGDRCIIDAARLNELTEALLNASFSPREIRLIMGENLIRFLQKSLPNSKILSQDLQNLIMQPLSVAYPAAIICFYVFAEFIKHTHWRPFRLADFFGVSRLNVLSQRIGCENMCHPGQDSCR